MSLTVVREDRHGLYMKVGGYIARPQAPAVWQHVRHLYPLPEKMPAKGQKVRARHLPGSQMIVVRDGDQAEQTWFAHGLACHMTPGCPPRKSEEVFEP